MGKKKEYYTPDSLLLKEIHPPNVQVSFANYGGFALSAPI